MPSTVKALASFGVAMPVEDLLFEMPDLPGRRMKLSYNVSQGRLSMNGQGLFSHLHQRQPGVDAGQILDSHDSILAKVRAQCVYKHAPLPYYQMAGLVQHQRCLLLFEFYCYEPHS